MIQYYLDKFGLVSSKGDLPFQAPTSQNGVLFTTVYWLAYDIKDPDFQIIRNCIVDGILWRAPDKSGGPDSHDNYTAFSVYAPPKDARRLFWNCLKRGFYVTGNHLIKYPQIWGMMWLAAFPNIINKIFMAPFFLVLFLLQNPKGKDNNEKRLGDTSGLQLQWVIIQFIQKHYPCFKPYKRWSKKLRKIAPHGEISFFEIYYGPDHPIAKAFL